MSDPFAVRAPVVVEFELGELRAIAALLVGFAPGGEVFDFALESGKLKLKRALCDQVGYGMPPEVLDKQACETARLDQWRSELECRGLL